MKTEQTENEILSENYENAECLLQKYKEETAQYDDVTAVLDAGIGAHYGDRLRVWNAVCEGLRYNCRNYELYLLLGHYYLSENLYQSYLCYENALFHCDIYEDKCIIEELLRQFVLKYNISVHKAAIIILSYNLLDYTKVCIESIRRTTPESAREIIVVDNGSGDGSVEWLREQPDIILVENKENRGFPGGCNQGIQASSFDSDIFLLNNDTMLPENAFFWLRMGVYDKEKNGSAGSVSNYAGGQVVVSGMNQISDLLYFGEKTNIPMIYPYEDRLFLSGFALLVKRSVIESVGLLDERFFPGNNEDVDLGLRILKAGYQNVLCKNSFILHFGSKTFDKDPEGYKTTAGENRKKINEKWGFDVDYCLHPKEELIQMIEEPTERPMRILDAECGCGATMGYIRGIYPYAETYGIESRCEMAEIASHMGTVICGEIGKMDIPWESEYFDYIIMGDMLEYLKEPEKILKRLIKYLKKDGSVIISVRNLKHSSVLFSLIKHDVFQYKKIYTKTEIQNLLAQNEFNVEPAKDVEIDKPGGRRDFLTKRVSIIVPCYNVAMYLDKCMESLIHQTIGIENIEIILVDDASVDNGATRALIMAYEQQFPDLIKAVLLPRNMRQGGARNAGISCATGEYITFCDADDWLLEEALERCYDIAKKYDVDIVEFTKKKVYERDRDLVLEKGDGSVFIELNTKERYKELLLNTLRGPGDNGSQYTFFRLSMIRENHISFVEHMFMEEISFTYPAKLYAKRYYYLDEQYYIYFQSPESTVRSSSWEDRKWDNLQAWSLLLEDLAQRGMLYSYWQEIEYLFFIMGFGHSIQLIFQKNCIMTREEWNLITNFISDLLPDIRQNQYVREEKEPFNQAWNELLLKLLDMEFTEEMAKEANQAVITIIKALYMLGGGN